MRTKFTALLAAAFTLLALPAAAQVDPVTAPGQNSTGARDLEFDQDRQRESRGNRRGGRAEKPAKAGAIDKKRGMAEAPAAIAAARVTCTPTDAGFFGQSKEGETVRNVYEVACSEGPGYVLITNAADNTLYQGFECFALKSGNETQAAEGKAVENALNCKLPANADPIAGFRKLAAPLTPGCTIDQARYLGASATTKEALYEVGCSGAIGSIVRIAGPGADPSVKSSATRCDRFNSTNVSCQYTGKEELVATIQKLVSQSGRNCQASDTRYVPAASPNNEEFNEVKCSDGSGFMIVSNIPDGAYKRVIECARATGIAGGCTLTDAIEAQNQEAGLYKQLASTAGFPCDVAQYRLLGMEQTSKREVVELQCKDRPEGAIAMLTVNQGGKSEIYDCTKVSYRKLNCGLTKLDATFPRLTQEVQSKGKTCQVNGVRGVGVVTSGAEYVEVSCASGPGFMLEYASGAGFPAPRNAYTCAEAAEIGGGCKLASAGSTRR